MDDDLYMDEDLYYLAREDGYRAYQNGLSRDDNPYNNNEEWDLYLAWEEGRSQAARDD
jgi:ribosome modulation factor